MSETGEVLAFFREGWQNYQDHLSKALAPLSAEQLALRAAPGLRSIEQLAHHLIAARAGWFRHVLKEGGKELSLFDEWSKPENPIYSASELVSGLATTWQVIEDVLGRYTLSDLQSLVQDRDDDGKVYDLTRGWVLWHVLEHDLHHGGEIGYSLGMHGLVAPHL